MNKPNQTKTTTNLQRTVWWLLEEKRKGRAKWVKATNCMMTGEKQSFAGECVAGYLYTLLYTSRYTLLYT